jgi:hypothetical protein
MRFLVKAKWPVEKANHLARHGELGQTVQSIVKDSNPEATYFYTDDGQRTALMVIDLQDASELPRIAEPWFLAFNASVEFIPTMILEDLERAGPSIGQAVEKYG